LVNEEVDNGAPVVGSIGEENRTLAEDRQVGLEVVREIVAAKPYATIVCCLRNAFALNLE
jgi:hypothetical protein